MPSLNIGFELAGLCGNGGDYSLPAKRKLLVTGGYCQISMVPTTKIDPGFFAAVYVGVYVYPTAADGPTYAPAPQQFPNYLDNADFGAVALNNPNKLDIAGPDWSCGGCFIKAILKTVGQESSVVIPRSALNWIVEEGGSIAVHMDQAFSGNTPITCDCEIQGVIDYQLV